jgi:hypothetical protein
VTQVLEVGEIYFLYRPRVEHDRVRGIEDVQRLFLVLKPRAESRYRLLVIGRKRLPEVAPEHDRFWGFVAEVVDRPEQLHDALDRQEYNTRTRGRRVQPEARPAGEGVYVIARHGDHTHLAYALELPERPGRVQQELNIEAEASYVASVKNPQAPSPPGAGLSIEGRGQFPHKLRERFAARRFIPIDPPTFLDYVGAEFVLIGAAHDASAELEIDLEAQVERSEQGGIFRALRIRREARPTEPLFRSEWR